MNFEALSKPMCITITVSTLVASNLLMTFAWYWHLKGGVKVGGESIGALALIILASWGIAFFEYCLAVPANRIGNAGGLSVAQLKIIQEVITVCVFLPFAMFFMGEKWRWDYLWAFLCMIAAVYFVNRSKL